MTGFTPYEQTTIDAVIETGLNLSVSEDTMAFKELINDEVLFAYDNVITRYRDILTDYIIYIDLTDDDYQRYKYQPQLFCYDYYGTPELASSILYINNMVSRTEFTKQSFMIFNDDIMDIIQELMSLNEADLETNRANCIIE